MLPKQILVCCLFAISLAAGQIFFKFAASDIQIRAQKSWFIAATSPWLIAALVLYALTAAIWVWVLMQVPLSRAYPFSLLGAALVPLLAHLVFGESLPPQFIVGISLVLLGLLLVQTA